MTNFRFLSLLGIGFISLGLCFSHVESAQAAVLPTGTLVKGSSSSVYYISADGKRYAFPDQTTYRSWYPDFSGVQTISDDDLASISLGGLVTIRPGSGLVKIQTDPKVYAVTRGGWLRWVQTEELARGLFGSDWNRRVSDVPDAFFTNYRIGLDIGAVSDFLEATQQMTAANIEADLFTRNPPQITPAPVSTTSTPSTNPAPTSTPSVPPIAPNTSTLPVAGRLTVLTNGNVSSGDIVTLLASVTRGFADRIIISFGTSSRTSICNQSPCRAEFAMPNVQATTTASFQAVFQIGEGANIVSNTSTAETFVVPNQITTGIQLHVPTQSIYGSSRTIRVEADPSLNVRSLRIMMDDAVLYECTGSQRCEYTEQESARGGTIHSVYVIVTDGDYRRLSSNTVIIPVVQ